MSACVSPPHESTSHIVEVAASIAHAASTGLPPLSKIFAPAVAASGFPVIAIQCRACSGGFAVCPLRGDWDVICASDPAGGRTARRDRARRGKRGFIGLESGLMGGVYRIFTNLSAKTSGCYCRRCIGLQIG